jgi:drug/metabolite transporter (DMT)-like permease
MIKTTNKEDFMTGQLISLGTALFWAITVLLFEYAGKNVGSLVVNTVRLIYGFLFIGMILWITQGHFLATTSIDGWKWMLLSGLFGFIVGDFFLFQAFILIGGRMSLLIYSVTPIFGAFIDFLVFKETLSWFTLAGILVTLMGIALAIYSRHNGKVKNVHLKKGIMFALIGALGQATGLIFSKLGLSEGLNAFEVTQMRILVGIVGFTIIVLLKKKGPDVIKAFQNKKASIALMIGSITGPVLGIASSIYAMEFAPIGVTSTIAQLNAVLIIPLSMIFLKEKIHIQEIIAALIAFGGVAILFIGG